MFTKIRVLVFKRLIYLDKKKKNEIGMTWYSHQDEGDQIFFFFLR